MGTSKQRKDRFLKVHPFCCFCGGSTPTETEDHWPPRSVFKDRGWPEGYVFPACCACNSVSRLDEPLMAMVCRMRPEESSADPDSWKKLLNGIRQSHPGVLESMSLSANEVRKVLRQKGVKLPLGYTTKDLPIVSLKHPAFHAAARNFAFKLLASLYYKHSGRILSPSGGVQFIWRTNTQVTADESSQDFLSHLTAAPKLVRRAITLNGQFNYRYGITEDEERPSGVFLVRFNRAITMHGVVLGDVQEYSDWNESTLLRPFEWKHS